MKANIRLFIVKENAFALKTLGAPNENQQRSNSK